MKVHPEWKTFDYFVVNQLQPALKFDVAISTRSEERDSEFAKTSVAASVMRMFMHAFNETTFKAALTDYLRNKLSG